MRVCVLYVQCVLCVPCALHVLCMQSCSFVHGCMQSYHLALMDLILTLHFTASEERGDVVLACESRPRYRLALMEPILTLHFDAGCKHCSEDRKQ